MSVVQYVSDIQEIIMRDTILQIMILEGMEMFSVKKTVFSVFKFRRRMSYMS